MTNPRAIQTAIQTLRLGLEPPPACNVWQWAEEHRRLSRDVTALPGRYRAARVPYQKEPQESFTDPTVQTTVLYWASRLGKTEILNNLEGHIIDADPASMLVVYPTLDSAKKWSKEFFTPMIQSTPRLRGKVSERRSRDSDNTILSKRFPGGKISAIGANSPSGFRQIQARVVVCDEIDAMENGPEGDPVSLAFKRCDNYPNSIQVLSSTPTIKGSSRIESYYLGSDQRKWHCPCPQCGTHQVLEWKQVIWPKDTPQDAVIICSNDACRAELTDHDRVAMIQNGEWRATQPFRGIRGYWLNGLNSVFPAKKGFSSKLHQFAQEFIDSTKKGKAAIQTWVNTFKCETWAEEADRVEAEPLLKRRENYGPEPPETVLVLTCGVDVQGDRLEYEVIGWGEGEESWGIEYGVIPGNTIRPEVWRDLEANVLNRTWKRSDGLAMRIAAAAVDSGAYTENVFAFTRPRFTRRIYAVKGSNMPGEPVVGPIRRKNKWRAPVVRIGTDTAKGLIYARLKLEEHGPGYMHFTRLAEARYDEEFFSQLTAEEQRTEHHKGHAVRVWHKTRPRNEALDIRVYATAALYLLRPNWTRLAARLRNNPDKSLESHPEKLTLVPDGSKADAETDAKEATMETPRAQKKIRTRRGFVGGWNRF